MSWQFACKLDEIRDGQMKMLTFDGVDILLVGTTSGISAIPPMCPHMDEPLNNGMCDGKLLTCMKHLWQWDIDSGVPVGAAETPLLMYDVKTEGDDVYVNLVNELIYDRNA